MFWADTVVGEIEGRFKREISSGHLIIRDEKTASGQVHVGSMMGVAFHTAISQGLAEKGIANTFKYEINDTDPMDGLPKYLDEKEYKPHMGKPLFSIPAPDGSSKNFAEYYGEEFSSLFSSLGFFPEVYYTHELYKSGQMNDVIRTALERADDIRKIYKEVSGSIKDEDWLPLNVVCEKCGKVSTTKVSSFDGERVHYTCLKDAVEWAEGCENESDISPFDGNATLPFKVEWAAKFKVVGVHIEGAGKDHYSKGGTRDTADRIAREVFSYEPPYGVQYEFFLVGGKKMSSSKGNAPSSKEMVDLLPLHIFRLALIRNIKRQSNFDPYGDTLPLLYDYYDKIAEKHFNGENDDETRMFTYMHPKNELPTPRFLPRFSQVAYLVQMPHLDLEKEVEKMKEGALTDEDKLELHARAENARYWIEKYAPEDFKFEIQETVPQAAKKFSDGQKEALKEVAAYISANVNLDGLALHTELHEIRKASGLEAKDFFSSLYLSILGKDSGPKAGWFLSVLDRDFVINRLEEVSS